MPRPTDQQITYMALCVMTELDDVARREMGIAKYGTALGRGNGRDFRFDAFQEAIDGICYARGLGDRVAEDLFRLAALRLMGA